MKMVVKKIIDDDQQSYDVIIKDGHILKPTELKNIGFLQKEPMDINCPACQQDSVSVVRWEPVTCIQYFVNWTKLCKKWKGRSDINHYCAQCGCYIGRYIEVCCSERCISKSARRKAANDDMTLKSKPKCCAERLQQVCERFKAKRAQQKIEVAAKSDNSVVTVEVLDKSSK